MTVYRYKDKDTGELFELDGSMADPPALELKMEGRRLVRDFSIQRVEVPRYDTSQKYADGSPMGSRGLGRGWPFAEHYDKKNRPLFANKRERDEAHAKAAACGELLDARELSQPGDVSKGRMFLDR